jgi:hypothetical protein
MIKSKGKKILKPKIFFYSSFEKVFAASKSSHALTYWG